MDGKVIDANGLQNEVLIYLSRLTGEPLTAETPIRLRSVQRAAFSSWARKQQLPIHLATMSTSVPFYVQELLKQNPADQPAPVIPQVALQLAVPVQHAMTLPPTVGIDIEEVENLPTADDYREHPFYQDNFTVAEIAYCLRQRDVRASLCGTWAAKEAILKANLATAPAGHLRGIEIQRDLHDRPVYPRCSLSISHTARTAVAICSSF